MDDEKLDKNGLIRVWLKIWTLLKLLVGDVDVVGKGDLQTQIDNMGRKVQECFQDASDGKKLVANAITGKGVSTLASDTFATIAANIEKIKTTARLQSKSATLNADTTSVTLKPDNGYDGLSQATASITLQEKTVALSTSAQNITPDNGKVLSKVVVPAVGGTAGTGDVLSGKTFSSAAGINKTGAMSNKAGTTVDAGATTQDDTYTYLSIPSDAFYDTNSKLRTKNSNLCNVQVFKFNETAGDRIYIPLHVTVKSSNRETHIINIIGSPGGNPTINIDVTNYNTARIQYGVIRNGIGNTAGNPTINGTAVSGTGTTTLNCANVNNLALRSGYTSDSWAAFIITSYFVELYNS